MTDLDAVTADFLRERYDEATVRRMMRAAEVEPVLVEAIERLSHEDCGYCGTRLSDRRGECTECATVKRAVLLAESLSPAESAPRPEGET